MSTVAIQGIKGSFHHQVALDYYGSEVEIKECHSFQAVVDSLLSGASDRAVMAIENSIAGSILPNYTLIDSNKLNIIGEHYIPIYMNLIGIPGQEIDQIKKVASHPMALLQCMEFFRKYPHLRLIEETDTAEVARSIAEKGTKGLAAVGSRAAAAIYGLEILAEGIHTIASNSTRFFILSRDEDSAKGLKKDKASLKFVMESEQGSLVSVLNVVRDFGLDMTKIQSIPIIETPWKYAFFIDVVFEEEENFLKAMEILKVMTEELKILGAYTKALPKTLLG